MSAQGHLSHITKPTDECRLTRRPGYGLEVWWRLESLARVASQPDEMDASCVASSRLGGPYCRACLASWWCASPDCIWSGAGTDRRWVDQLLHDDSTTRPGRRTGDRREMVSIRLGPIDCTEFMHPSTEGCRIMGFAENIGGGPGMERATEGWRRSDGLFGNRAATRRRDGRRRDGMTGDGRGEEPVPAVRVEQLLSPLLSPLSSAGQAPHGTVTMASNTVSTRWKEFISRSPHRAGGKCKSISIPTPTPTLTGLLLHPCVQFLQLPTSQVPPRHFGLLIAASQKQDFGPDCIDTLQPCKGSPPPSRHRRPVTSGSPVPMAAVHVECRRPMNGPRLQGSRSPPSSLNMATTPHLSTLKIH